MSWYKISQQQLMFYPWQGSPGQSSQNVQPVSTNPATSEAVYKCSGCGKPVSERDLHWVEDKEGKGQSYQLNQINKERVAEGLREVSRYLMPTYQKFTQHLKDEGIKPDTIYQYQYHSWEAQIPMLPSVIEQYPELSDVCRLRDSWFGDVCNLISSPPTEISGSALQGMSNFITNPEQFIKETLEKASLPFSVGDNLPVCQECYGKYRSCASCDEPILPGTGSAEAVWDSSESYCESCLDSGAASTCMGCGRADNQEDMHYVEDDGEYCNKCYEARSSEHLNWAINAIADLDIPVGKHNPISAKVLNNLNEFLTRYVQKYNDKPLEENEWDKLLYMAKKSNMSNGGIDYLEDARESRVGHASNLLEGVTNNMAAQDYMKDQYPGISNYQDLPFDVGVEENFDKSISGFTVTVTPSKKFFDYAKRTYPDVEQVWNSMSNTPHHSSVLAYARCAYEGQDLVINNLQRDADFGNWDASGYSAYQGGKGDKETAKWLDKVTKNWDVYLLNLIKAMAIAGDFSAYLTTFDQQKQKWSNLPVHKSRRTYEEVPEKMGFPLEYPGVSGLVETTHSDEPMYQVAELIDAMQKFGYKKNWYKRIK